MVANREAPSSKISLTNGKNTTVLSFVHVTLVFLRYMCKVNGAMDILAPDFPWADLSSMLNSVLCFHELSNYNTIDQDEIPKPEVLERDMTEKPDVAGDHDESIPPATDEFRPFPEEWTMQGLKWTPNYFPVNWFVNENVEMEKHYMEAESMRAEHRPERVLWLGVQLTKTTKRMHYDANSHRLFVKQVLRQGSGCVRGVNCEGRERQRGRDFGDRGASADDGGGWNEDIF